jgi:hypothetical protein
LIPSPHIVSLDRVGENLAAVAAAEHRIDGEHRREDRYRDRGPLLDDDF